MNILILENVDHLDADYTFFINDKYKDDNVEILYSLSDLENNEKLYRTLLNKLAWADKISICSSLTENVDKLLPLIHEYKNITHIDIKYLYSGNDILRLCKYLNEEKNQQIYDLIKNRTVTEILINTYELESVSCFRKYKYTYTTVPLVYIKKHDLIWHKERVHVPDVNDFLYDLVDKPKNTGKTYTIEKDDIATFDSLIDEVKTFVKYQKESVEEQETDDYDELIYEKNGWLKILNKYF